MKLLFKTTDAETLKSEIIKTIEDKKLSTWSITTSDKVKYLKHTQQWGEKGVISLTSIPSKGYLAVEVLKFKSTIEDVKDFEGYYLGRFCELIFVNFPGKFTSIDQ